MTDTRPADPSWCCPTRHRAGPRGIEVDHESHPLLEMVAEQWDRRLVLRLHRYDHLDRTDQTWKSEPMTADLEIEEKDSDSPTGWSGGDGVTGLNAANCRELAATLLATADRMDRLEGVVPEQRQSDRHTGIPA